MRLLLPVTSRTLRSSSPGHVENYSLNLKIKQLVTSDPFLPISHELMHEHAKSVFNLSSFDFLVNVNPYDGFKIKKDN